MTRWCGLILAIVGALLAVTRTAGAEEYRIFAGTYVSELFQGLDTKYKLQDPDLREKIADLKLAALLIPLNQPPAGDGKQVVWLCDKGARNMTAFHLAVDDYKSLVEFSQDQVVIAAAALREQISVSSPDEQAKRSENLLQALADVKDVQERKKAEVYAGAVLADVNPSAPGVDALVRTFKAYQEERVKSVLAEKLAHSKVLEPGKPLVTGSHIWSARQIASMPSDAHGPVKDFVIQGAPFKCTWVGDSLVVVPQGAPATTNPTDQTGLGVHQPTGVAAHRPVGTLNQAIKKKSQID